MKDKIEATSNIQKANILISNKDYTPENCVFIYLFAYGDMSKYYDTSHLDVLWNDFKDFNDKQCKCIIDEQTFSLHASKYLKEPVNVIEVNKKEVMDILNLFKR